MGRVSRDGGTGEGEKGVKPRLRSVKHMDQLHTKNVIFL